jgi:copper homeostasis protein
MLVKHYFSHGYFYKYLFMNTVKEVCVESFDEAVRAVRAGATRIELCENLSAGGTTPSFGTIKKCLEVLSVPVMVMIRPRGGNFNYSQEEFEIMQEDIFKCKDLSVQGVVFGLLDEANNIDETRTRLLVQLSRPMQVTFHKAIDNSNNLYENVAILKKIGVDRILTSGGKEKAKNAKKILNRMIEIAGAQVSIIVAGKVTHENFAEIKKIIPAKEYHGRKLIAF